MEKKISFLWSPLCVYYGIILNFTLAGFHHTVFYLLYHSFCKPPWFFISCHLSCVLNDERMLCDHIMVHLLKWLKARIYLARSRLLITSWSLSSSPYINFKKEISKFQHILPCPEMSSTTWFPFSWSGAARDLSVCTKTLSAASQILSS